MSRSTLSQPWSLLPLLCFCPVEPRMRILVVTDHIERLDLTAGVLETVPDFAVSREMRTEEGGPYQVSGRRVSVFPDAPSAEPYPLVVFDLEHFPCDVNAGLERCLQPAGTVVQLDWRPRRHRLRELFRWRGRSSHGGSARSRSLARLSFDVEPTLEKPRYILRHGARYDVPVTGRSGWRRLLLKCGLSYFMPRHSVSIESPSLQDSPVAIVLRQLFGSGDVRELLACVGSVYVSTTSSLTVEAVRGNERYFVRFPLTEASCERATRQAHILDRLHTAAPTTLVPRNVGQYPQAGVPAFVQSAVSGRNVEKRFPQMTATAAVRYVGGALSFLEGLHAGFARHTRYDDSSLGEFVDGRLSLVRERLEASGFRTGGMASLAHDLKRELLGKRCVVTLAHGDFKIGNCLFDEGANVTGVVDWDLGAENELAIFDVANLIGRAIRDRERMTISKYALSSGAATAVFEPMLRKYWAASGSDPVSGRHLALLHWLDRAYKQVRFNEQVDDFWIRKNLEPVAAGGLTGGE